MQDVIAFDQNETCKMQFEIPEIDECPICHHALQPTILNSRYVMDDPNGESLLCYLYTAFFCPKCRGVFMGKFSESLDLRFGPNSVYLGQYSLFPTVPDYDRFSDKITDLSATFVQTYEQAQYAESSGLNQICGIGYRKALEYLVKDYLCHKVPADENAIKTEALGRSLHRIEDSRIQALAQRATWIGNDETHYVKKHEDLDVMTMKVFINAMVHFIDSDLALEQALGIERA